MSTAPTPGALSPCAPAPLALPPARPPGPMPDALADDLVEIVRTALGWWYCEHRYQDAWDVVQEALLDLVRLWRRSQDEEAVRRQAATIGRRKRVVYARREGRGFRGGRRRAGADRADLAAAPGGDPDPALDVGRAVARLPGPAAATARAVWADGLTPTEAAARLAISRRRVRGHLAAAGRLLAGYGGGEGIPQIGGHAAARRATLLV